MWRAASLGLLFLVAAAGGCAGPPEAGSAPSIGDYAADLSNPVDEPTPETRLMMHRLRNLDAMVDLVSSLPHAERPRSIAYLASGDHLAPLGLCELLPEGETCRLIFTEVDPGLQVGIDEGVAHLAQADCLQLVKTGPDIQGASGRREWQLAVGSNRATIELRVTDPDTPGSAALITPQLLNEVDLVISHDWSGEPIGNLQVIRQFVAAARHRPESPPMLMIEDLEAHLFPVDLSPFVRRATTSRPYGHRDSGEGAGRHGRVELGEPIFGGAALLDFSDPWWREIDNASLDGFFDFLLMNQFDSDRRNVLRGGPDPLVAPMLLDWWTGYGARGIDGKPFEPGSASRILMLDAAVKAAELAGPSVRRRIACRLRLYSLLLRIRAAGGDTLDLMPGAALSKRGDALVSADMERLYRQALRRAGDFRAERDAFAKYASEVLVFLDDDRALEVLARCTGSGTAETGEPNDKDLRQAYRELVASMASEDATIP